MVRPLAAAGIADSSGGMNIRSAARAARLSRAPFKVQMGDPRIRLRPVQKIEGTYMSGGIWSR
jgi:hypothetical protein